MKTILVSTTLLSLGCVPWAMADGDKQGKDLSELSLEDLMKIEVTTAAKEAQSYLNVPSAIYVVTSDAIRRSGARNIPEAIRLAPGVQVAQISADQWQVSVRGFSTQYADKLLVLIDGRSVYDTTFSGVFWDTQEINVEDIDRIEVIRGPGGSLWGTNAVNGTINVITKKAADTQGTSLTLQSSSVAPYDTSLRYGGKWGREAYYRVFGKAVGEGSLYTTAGPSANDAWSDLLAGFRLDWKNKRDSATLTGGLNSEHLGGTMDLPQDAAPYYPLWSRHYPSSDFNFNLHWERLSGFGQGAELQAYHSTMNRRDPADGEFHDTWNADLQLPIVLGKANKLTLGAGFQSVSDSFQSGVFASFSRPKLVEDIFSFSLHDEWKLSRNVTWAGSAKLEHNPFTGWEFQPSTSLTWNPSARQSVWTAISRVVRTPSVADEAMTINAAAGPAPGGGAYDFIIQGNPNFDSEIELSSEFGYRYAASDRLFLDLTGFYSHYSQLRSFLPGTPYVVGNTEFMPEYFANGLSAVVGGLEGDVKFQASRNWRLEGSYTLLQDHYYFPGGVTDFDGLATAERDGSAPEHQVTFISNLNLPHQFEFDSSLAYNSKITAGPISPYARVDFRLGWNPNPHTELSLGVQSAFTLRHAEALNVFTEPDYIPRNLYLKVNFKF